MDGDNKETSVEQRPVVNGDVGNDIAEEMDEKKMDSGKVASVKSNDVEMTEDDRATSAEDEDEKKEAAEESKTENHVNGGSTPTDAASADTSGDKLPAAESPENGEETEGVKLKEDEKLKAEGNDDEKTDVKDGDEKVEIKEKESVQDDKEADVPSPPEPAVNEEETGGKDDEKAEGKDIDMKVKEKDEKKSAQDGDKEVEASSTSEPANKDDEISPSKNLRKRKLSNGYQENETSSDDDYMDMIVEKKPKPATTATEKSISVPVAAINVKPKPVAPSFVGQSVSLVGTNLLPSQQVRMVLPAASSSIITSGGQQLLISQPQTSIITPQGVAAGVVLYPQIQPGSASAVMSNMLTTAAQKVNSAKTTYGISIVGMTNTKAKAVQAMKTGPTVTSVTASNQQVPKVDKLDLRAPNNSFEMIELVKWELKQGVYHRPKNFKIKPDSELGSMAKFLRDFGQDLVKESVYSDLVQIQSKRSDHGKLTEKEKKDFQKLKSVHSELRDKVGPLKVTLSDKCSCGFRTESSNVMFWHKQHPHIKESNMKCAVCKFDTRDPSAFTFHMEAEHSRKAKYIEKPAFWPCNLCPYETNLRNKLTQHKFRCTKTFKLSLNLHPAWLPGPESNYCLEKIFYKNPVLANMNRIQQQQQQQQQQQGQRQVMPIMPKGAAGQSVRPIMQGQTVRQLIKNHPQQGSGVRNPTLLAKLGQNIQGAGQQRVFRQNPNIVPNVNMFKQGNNLMPASSMVKKPANIAYARQINATGKVNSVMGKKGMDGKGPPNKPNGFEVCEICGGYVKDRTALRIHFFYAHRIDMPHGVFDRVHPPLYCATCFARFWTAQGLQKHLDVHKEDSSGGVAGKCIVCLHRVPNILMHMKIVHNKAFVNFLRECKCIFCGLKFPSKSVVESHMAAVHGVVVKSGAQPQPQPHQPPTKKPQMGPKSQTSGKGDLVKGSVCVLCNLNFGRNVDLTRHCMRVHHTCMKCGMVVADKESLMKHSCLESPGGLRNCEVCHEKGFHPAYHVKHVRDKHLRKLSVKMRRLERGNIEKWTKRPVSFPGKVPIVPETIELSDDDEPAPKRQKTESAAASPDPNKMDKEGKNVNEEVVMLTDEEDTGKENKSDKSDSKNEVEKKVKDEDEKKAKDEDSGTTDMKPETDAKCDKDSKDTCDEASEVTKDSGGEDAAEQVKDVSAEGGATCDADV